METQPATGEDRKINKDVSSKQKARYEYTLNRCMGFQTIGDQK